MFAAICVHRDEAGEGNTSLTLLAHEYSPRVETVGPSLVTFDASGLERLFGGPRALADHVAAAAASRGWSCGVAMAGTRTAAALLARSREGVTVVPAGREARALAPLPLALLAGTAGVDVEEPPPARSKEPRAPGSHLHYRMAPAPVQARRPNTVPPDAPECGDVGRPFRGGTPGLKPRPTTITTGDSFCTSTGSTNAVHRSNAEVRDAIEMFTRWGVYTLGDLAALPADGVHARLGRQGVAWQRLARGEDLRPLVRDPAEERFEQHLALEWPIEGLEPLSFVLARLLEPLCQQLERRDRGAVGLRLWLKLVTKTMFTRYLPVPVPIRDPRVLRTLLALDLDSHRPPAGIDEVTIACDVAPGRIVQHSLLTRPLPSPDRVSTLMARLTALMGEGQCGAPSLPDTHRPGAFLLQPFVPEADGNHDRLAADDLRLAASSSLSPAMGAGGTRTSAKSTVSPVRTAGEGERRQWQGQPQAMLRRFRQPVAAQVSLLAERPHRLATRHAGLRGGIVVQSAGPWRTSGCWWQTGAAARERGPWDRDEWDVALDDRVVYRLSRDRATGTWAVEGYWD
jgi:hypothetical protein